MDMLKVFEKAEFGRVRVVECEGEPWFVAKDVCECLELTNTSQTLSHLDDDEKGIISNDTPGGKQEMSIISEPGLYSLILRSRKPEAKAFKQWIIHEVVPSIRKRGLYATEAVMDRILDAPDFGISLLQQYKFEREQRKLVEAHRDEAVRTKAEIGSRREATAMNTASRLSKENEHLRDDIGDSRTWKQVKAIPWLEEVFEVSQAMYSVAGRKLADMPRRMGYEIREVEDSRYGSVKAYHTDVIEAFQHALKADHNILWKYRRRCAAEGLPDMVKQPCSLVRRTGLLS
ncbi:BRO-N domain-containing protein [Bilophila wadsworthia]|uniref:BRO-N domain-containing protein n=1 Tax=Bilophila wadsworthia TaxID=35833 RepID=UPI0032202C1C